MYIVCALKPRISGLRIGLATSMYTVCNFLIFVKVKKISSRAFPGANPCAMCFGATYASPSRPASPIQKHLRPGPHRWPRREDVGPQLPEVPGHRAAGVQRFEKSSWLLWSSVATFGVPLVRTSKGEALLSPRVTKGRVAQGSMVFLGGSQFRSHFGEDART